MIAAGSSWACESGVPCDSALLLDGTKLVQCKYFWCPLAFRRRLALAGTGRCRSAGDGRFCRARYRIGGSVDMRGVQRAQRNPRRRHRWLRRQGRAPAARLGQWTKAVRAPQLRRRHRRQRERLEPASRRCGPVWCDLRRHRIRRDHRSRRACPSLRRGTAARRSRSRDGAAPPTPGPYGAQCTGSFAAAVDTNTGQGCIGAGGIWFSTPQMTTTMMRDAVLPHPPTKSGAAYGAALRVSADVDVMGRWSRIHKADT